VTYTIRQPAASDATAIADVHVGSWREAYGHLLPADFFSEEYVAGRRRMWDQVLNDPRDDVEVRVAESGGSIVGFAWVGPTFEFESAAPPRDRQLYAIYVRAAHHGTGAGQALLDAALGDAPAMLWVAKANPRAIAFYARNGFVFDGVEQADAHAPGLAALRMIR
jgi:GNAT superfamily N-acetyltransferase